MTTLFDKYKIEKRDGTLIDPNAQYFVLRLDTDYHARVALEAYANSVRESDAEFAQEIDAKLKQIRDWWAAKVHLKDVEGMIEQMKGMPGLNLHFYNGTFLGLKKRFEKGERTESLLKEIMELD